VSDNELNTSKHGFIDRFPRTFGTKTQVASTFADDEFTGHFAKDPHYWKSYRERIDGVNKEEVLAVAKKYLVLDKLIVLVVGEKEEILLAHPSHPVKLTDLVQGPSTDLPLRDPLTMKPIKKEP
jgi:predicted Zn-dependent peptidase